MKTYRRDFIKTVGAGLIGTRFGSYFPDNLPGSWSSLIESEIIVNTKYGKLKGKLIDEIGVFKGVPYSGPSDGLNRFLPPTPLTQWDGIRDTTNFIPIKSYQPPDNNLKERSTLIFALQCRVENDPVRKIREKLSDLG
jgi:carboxylesterase type B